MTPSLLSYLEHEILPRYDHFDAAHRRDHIDTVIAQSLELAKHYDVDIDMVYTIAAYHDTGIVEGRERHHTVSKRILLEDEKLRQWFSIEQIQIMGDAVEDHRASSKGEPRSIYGKIVAEADRVIDPKIIILRTIQYGLSNYPELGREQQYERAVAHLKEKYGEGGYLKLWIPYSSNAERLSRLREIIADPRKLREEFDKIYDSLS